MATEWETICDEIIEAGEKAAGRPWSVSIGPTRTWIGGATEHWVADFGTSARDNWPTVQENRESSEAGSRHKANAEYGVASANNAVRLARFAKLIVEEYKDYCPYTGECKEETLAELWIKSV